MLGGQATQRGTGLTCRQVANPLIRWVGLSTSQRLGSEWAAGLGRHSWGIFDLPVSEDMCNVEVVVKHPQSPGPQLCLPAGNDVSFSCSF